MPDWAVNARGIMLMLASLIMMLVLWHM